MQLTLKKLLQGDKSLLDSLPQVVFTGLKKFSHWVYHGLHSGALFFIGNFIVVYGIVLRF